MSNKKSIMLVTQIHITSDKDEQFLKWQEKVHTAITKVPGYISQTISKPNPPIQKDWVIIQHFISTTSAKNWLKSAERKKLIKEAVSLSFEGVDHFFITEDKTHNSDAVTATIRTVIKHENEEKFLDWDSHMALVESEFPGFIGHKLEKPQRGISNEWITIVTFDSNKNLERWFNSQERKKLVDELNKISVQNNLTKSYSGFDFWFNPTHEKRTIWKENMLVLLTLYPVVFLLSYIHDPLMSKGIPFWLALFLGNAVSTSILGWITVPRLMQLFSWWINPPKKLTRKYTILGTVIVIGLYILVLFICWLISKNFKLFYSFL